MMGRSRTLRGVARSMRLRAGQSIEMGPKPAGSTAGKGERGGCRTFGSRRRPPSAASWPRPTGLGPWSGPP